MLQLDRPAVSSNSTFDALRTAVVDRTAAVGVVGAGYVGLPLATAVANARYHVTCFDRNPAKVRAILDGRSYIRDVSSDELQTLVLRGGVSATDDMTALAGCDVLVVCVPTPLNANKTPDLSDVVAAAEFIGACVRPGQLVVLESTTYPGTTANLVLPILERSGLHAGEDFFLAFSPERIDPGNARFDTRNTSRIVGGVTPRCLDLAALFYEQAISAAIVRVSSTQVAELTKVFENAFRAVNIALVNELTQLCDRMQIDMWEVVEAAASKPFGFMKFLPGPGVGGHCIPLDPHYLSWKAREYDFLTQLIELAGHINGGMPYFVRDKFVRTLNERDVPLHNARILAIGVAYKKDCDDWRTSPAIKVIELLEHGGANVAYFDPLIASYTDRAGNARSSLPWSAAIAADYDAVIVLTDHSSIDWESLAAHARLIFDTRNVFVGRRSRENLVLL